ncbi:MAG TPA: sulfite oxidase-like oxidoreductase [Candidatus Binataceae bacterium]|nr:sulfite oxidase-like oxidoreductase [Candidatus Binataceae bacterium]
MSKPPKPSESIDPRLPPGQFLTTNFPVLSYGPTPRFNPAKWDFKLIGLVEPELRFTWAEFRALKRTTQVADFHCVTTWSRYDNRWEGVKVRDLMALVKLDQRAQYVFVRCDGGYSTNLPLAAFLDDDVMLAWGHDGRDLEPDHGFPLRLVVPKLYAWKSAKWVRSIEFAINDQRGFWEVRGYHNHADPWSEERYSFQEEAEE